MKAVNVGDKVKLNNEGVIRIYEIKEISGDKYKLFNKFQISFYETIDFIIKNEVKD